MHIVTGASSGIGRATATALASRGQRVLAVARRWDALLELQSSYPELLRPLQADVSTTEGVEAIANAASSHIVCSVVHAAGSRVELARYQQLEVTRLVQDMAVHVAAPIAINNQLQAQFQHTRLLYVDSYSALEPRVGWAGYSIVKAAAQMAAKAAQEEIDNATIIRVFPGGVRTPLVEAVLQSTSGLPTAVAFQALEAAGKINDADTIGQYLSDILLLATAEQLEQREFWDFSNPADRVFQPVSQ